MCELIYKIFFIVEFIVLVGYFILFSYLARREESLNGKSILYKLLQVSTIFPIVVLVTITDDFVKEFINDKPETAWGISLLILLVIPVVYNLFFFFKSSKSLKKSHSHNQSLK
ncbi:MAG: hypothetical protein IPO78_10385 [Saprospiraceae bacterium]|nr:hypothetical protein [Saprospiraceae bacterium]